MLKNRLGAFAATALVALCVAGPAAAQDSERTGQGEGRTTTTEQRGGFDLGWLGLLGLAGLAGLRKPAPTVVHQAKEGNARAF